jgi:hypothetical protein
LFALNGVTFKREVAGAKASCGGNALPCGVAIGLLVAGAVGAKTLAKASKLILKTL